MGKWKLSPKGTDKRTLNEIIDAYAHVKIRPDWEAVKLAVMEKCLLAKFTQNKSLGELLISTGSKELIEDSPRDSYWGIGKDGKGLNHLGKLLMKVRSKLSRGLHGASDK